MLLLELSCFIITVLVLVVVAYKSLLMAGVWPHPDTTNTTQNTKETTYARWFLSRWLAGGFDHLNRGVRAPRKPKPRSAKARPTKATPVVAAATVAQANKVSVTQEHAKAKTEPCVVCATPLQAPKSATAKMTTVTVESTKADREALEARRLRRAQKRTAARARARALAEKKGRHPKNGQELPISSRSVPASSAGSDLKDVVANPKKERERVNVLKGLKPENVLFLKEEGFRFVNSLAAAYKGIKAEPSLMFVVGDLILFHDSKEKRKDTIFVELLQEFNKEGLRVVTCNSLWWAAQGVLTAFNRGGKIWLSKDGKLGVNETPGAIALGEDPETLAEEVLIASGFGPEWETDHSPIYKMGGSANEFSACKEACREFNQKKKTIKGTKYLYRRMAEREELLSCIPGSSFSLIENGLPQFGDFIYILDVEKYETQGFPLYHPTFNRVYRAEWEVVVSGLFQAVEISENCFELIPLSTPRNFKEFAETRTYGIPHIEELYQIAPENSVVEYVPHRKFAVLEGYKGYAIVDIDVRESEGHYTSECITAETFEEAIAMAEQAAQDLSEVNSRWATDHAIVRTGGGIRVYGPVMSVSEVTEEEWKIIEGVSDPLYVKNVRKSGLWSFRCSPKVISEKFREETMEIISTTETKKSIVEKMKDIFAAFLKMGFTAFSDAVKVQSRTSSETDEDGMTYSQYMQVLFSSPFKCGSNAGEILLNQVYNGELTLVVFEDIRTLSVAELAELYQRLKDSPSTFWYSRQQCVKDPLIYGKLILSREIFYIEEDQLKEKLGDYLGDVPYNHFYSLDGLWLGLGTWSENPEQEDKDWAAIKLALSAIVLGYEEGLLQSKMPSWDLEEVEENTLEDFYSSKETIYNYQLKEVLVCEEDEDQVLERLLTDKPFLTCNPSQWETLGYSSAHIPGFFAAFLAAAGLSLEDIQRIGHYKQVNGLFVETIQGWYMIYVKKDHCSFVAKLVSQPKLSKMTIYGVKVEQDLSQPNVVDYLGWEGDLLVSREMGIKAHALLLNNANFDILKGFCSINDGYRFVTKSVAIFHGSINPENHMGEVWDELFDDVDLIICCNWGIAVPSFYHHKCLPVMWSRITKQAQTELLKTRSRAAASLSHPIMAMWVFEENFSLAKLEWAQVWKNPTAKEAVFGTVGAKEILTKYKQATICSYSLVDDRCELEVSMSEKCDQTPLEESSKPKKELVMPKVQRTVKLKNQRGTVGFLPKNAHKEMSEVAEVLKQEGLDSNYLDAGSRLQVPTFGVVTQDGSSEVVEIQSQILDGYPISLRLRKDDVVDTHFLPVAGTTSPAQAMEIKLDRNIPAKFFMRSFFWKTTAWFISLFTAGAKTLAGDIYARMPSFMKLKTLVTTKEQGVEVYLGSCKDGAKFLKALILHDLVYGDSIIARRKSIRRAALQLGVSIEFLIEDDKLPSEEFLAWLEEKGDDVEKRRFLILKKAENKAEVEMDGMSFIGYDAKGHAMKSNRPYQGRAMLQHTNEYISLLKFMDRQSEEFTDDPVTAQFYFDLINNDEIMNENGLVDVGAYFTSKKWESIKDLFDLSYPKGLKIDASEIRAQMIKGLFRPTGWLKRNVIIWDLNSVKDTSKNILKKHLKNEAIIPAHKDASWVHGLLQDLGIGQMSFGTQPAQYAEKCEGGTDLVEYANRNWLNILTESIKSLTMFEALDPSKEGQAPTIDSFKAIKEIIDLKSSLELGNEEEEIEASEDDSMDVFANMSSAEEQMISYFNDVSFRKSLLDQIKSTLVELRMNIVSYCMIRIGLKMPISDYLVDFNDLPPTYVNNKLTRTGFVSEMMQTVFPENVNHFADQVQLEINGKLRPIPVIGFSGRWFWSKYGEKKADQPDAIIALMYRYPVANRDMVVPVLCLNMGKFGWEPGIYANSLTVKEYFCGDTDGDRNAILPLDVNFTLTQNILRVEENADYGLVAAFGQRSDFRQVEIEGLVAGATPAFFSMEPGFTELVMGSAGRLVGGAALMQQNTKGVLDTRAALEASIGDRQIPMIGGNKVNHSFVDLLGLLLSFDSNTVQNLRGVKGVKALREEIMNLKYMRLSYNDQVQVIFDALSKDARQDLVGFLMNDIVQPYSILSPGFLEVAISSQKKDLQQQYYNILHYFVCNSSLEIEGRDTIKLRDDSTFSDFREMFLNQKVEDSRFFAELFSFSKKGSSAPVCVVEGCNRNDTVFKNYGREMRAIIGGENQFANEEWMFSRQTREVFQKETGYDIYRIYAMSRYLHGMAKGDVSRFIKLQICFHMIAFLRGAPDFDIQFNSTLGAVIRDLLQITGANVDGKAVEWIEALRLSDIEKLSNDKTRAIYLDDKSWGIIDSDNLDWAIARWSDRNKEAFLNIKSMLEPWVYNQAPYLAKPQFAKKSMLTSGHFSETLRVSETVGASSSIQGVAQAMFSLEEGGRVNNLSSIAAEFGMRDALGKSLLSLVSEVGGVPSLNQSWSDQISSGTQHSAMIAIAKNCPKWLSTAIRKVLDVLLLKREAATLKLKVVTPKAYADQKNVLVSDKEYSETLLATFEDVKEMNLNPSQMDIIQKWMYRLKKQTPDAATNRAYRAMASSWSPVNEPEALLAFLMMSIAQNQACYTQDEQGVPTNFFVPVNNVATEETYFMVSSLVRSLTEGRRKPLDSIFVNQLTTMFYESIEARYGADHRMSKTALEDIQGLNRNANAILRDAEAILGKAYTAFFALLFDGVDKVHADALLSNIFNFNMTQGYATSGKFEKAEVKKHALALASCGYRGFSFGKNKATTSLNMQLTEQQLDIIYRVLFEGADLCWVEADDDTHLDKLNDPFFSNFVFIARKELPLKNFAAFSSERTLQEMADLVGQAVYFGDDDSKFEMIGRNGLIIDAAINERLNGWKLNGESIKVKWVDLRGKVSKSMFYQILSVKSEVTDAVRFWLSSSTRNDQVAQVTYAAFRMASSLATQEIGESSSLFCQDMQSINYHCFKWQCRKSSKIPMFWKAFANIVTYDDFENEAYLKLPSHDTVLQLAGWWTRAVQSNNPFQSRIEDITRQANKNKKLIPRRVMASMYQVGLLGLTYEQTWKDARESAHAAYAKHGKFFNDQNLLKHITTGYGISEENLYWYWLYQLIVGRFFKDHKERLLSRGTYTVLQQIAHEAIKDVGSSFLNEGMVSVVIDEEMLQKVDAHALREIDGEVYNINVPNAKASVAASVKIKEAKKELMFFVDKTDAFLHLDMGLRSKAEEMLSNADDAAPSKGAGVVLSTLIETEEGFKKASFGIATGVAAMLPVTMDVCSFKPVSYNAKTQEITALTTGLKHSFVADQFAIYAEAKSFDLIQKEEWSIEAVEEMITGFFTTVHKFKRKSPIILNQVRWSADGNELVVKVPMKYNFNGRFVVLATVTISAAIVQDSEAPVVDIKVATAVAKTDESIEFDLETETVIEDEDIDVVAEQEVKLDKDSEKVTETYDPSSYVDTFDESYMDSFHQEEEADLSWIYEE